MIEANIQTKEQLTELLNNDNGCAIIAKDVGARTLAELMNFVGFDVIVAGYMFGRFSERGYQRKCMVLKKA